MITFKGIVKKYSTTVKRGDEGAVYYIVTADLAGQIDPLVELEHGINKKILEKQSASSAVYTVVGAEAEEGTEGEVGRDLLDIANVASSPFSVTVRRFAAAQIAVAKMVFECEDADTATALLGELIQMSGQALEIDIEFE